MKHFHRPIVAACALLVGTLAQAAPADDDWPTMITAAVNDAMSNVMADFDEASVDFAADELGSERVVKGAPYCADAIHESIQTLTDGNRIVRKQQSRLCRDGEGRTRQEVERDGRKLVWLRDPVAKQAWLLDPTRKTARKLSLGGHAMFHDAMEAANADAWREYAEKAREQARAMADRAREQARAAQEQGRERERGRGASGATLAVPALPPVPPTPPAPVIVARGGAPGEVQVVRIGEDGNPAGLPGHGDFRFEMPAPPPTIRWHAMHMAPRGAGVTSALGSKDIEGVRSNGERTTWTIEAGKVGNEKPIVITREVWTSPDLLLTVLSRDADPRNAERVYRLANVKRGEPDAALMKVPSDYATSGIGAASAPSPAPSPRKPSGAAPKG